MYAEFPIIVSSAKRQSNYFNILISESLKLRLLLMKSLIKTNKTIHF